MEGAEVTSILVESSRVRGATLRDGEIAAETVVVCAGPWTTRLLDPIGVSLPIEAHRTPTCMFLRPPDLPQGGPILSDGVNLVYLRDMGERLMRIALFGWTPDPAEPDHYDETVSRVLLESLRAALCKRYTTMRYSAFMGGFSALYDMTPDAHPIIGPLHEIDGLWCNCGWSGNGFASAPSVGRSIAGMITGNGEGMRPFDVRMAASARCHIAPARDSCNVVVHPAAATLTRLRRFQSSRPPPGDARRNGMKY